MSTDAVQGVALEAGRELDALVAERVMGIVPRIEWMVSADGGKSGAMFTSDDIGMRSKEDLCAWLRDKHRRGMLLGHVVVEWKRYPPYSRHIAAAWEVVEWFLGRGEPWPHSHGWFVQVYRAQPDGWGCQIGVYEATADTAPLAICRAALAATAPTPESAVTESR